MHTRVLRLTGGEAQAVLEATFLMLARPGSRMLDAGCGTGELARRLLKRVPGVDLTLLDASAPMLRRTQGLAARRTHGSILALPLADNLFTPLLSAWVIETLADPHRSIKELARVTWRAGNVCLAFCCAPAAVILHERAMNVAIQVCGTRRPLDPKPIASTLQGAGCRRIVVLPCRGPATVLMARKED